MVNRVGAHMQSGATAERETTHLGNIAPKKKSEEPHKIKQFHPNFMSGPLSATLLLLLNLRTLLRSDLTVEEILHPAYISGSQVKPNNPKASTLLA